MPREVMSWSLTSSGGEVIYGNSHLPEDRPRGAAIMTHGFLGYKDYGFIPAFTDALASMGLAAHRFNLSHSGMTENTETFEKPELFAKNTWNRQVEDIERLINAFHQHELVGIGMPLILVGHSRGGVASLLTAGRQFEKGASPIEAVVTIAAPDHTSAISAEQRETLDERGYIEVTSNRTGQTLAIDRAFWDEQDEDPRSHDLMALATRIECPALVIHGESDDTVPPEAGVRLAEAIPNAKLRMLEGGNHVLNTPNPFPMRGEPSQQLHEAIETTSAFIDHVLSPV